MLSLRRWVTVLVGAGFGKTESFKPSSSDAIKPVRVKTQVCYPVFRYFCKSIKEQPSPKIRQLKSLALIYRRNTGKHDLANLNQEMAEPVLKYLKTNNQFVHSSVDIHSSFPLVNRESFPLQK